MNRNRSSLPHGVSRATLRFILLGGALAWLMHLVLAYVIAEFGIISGLIDTRWSGLDAVSWLLLALSVAMLALAAAATGVSWRHRVRLGPYAKRDDEVLRTVRFCARFGLAANLTFLAIIAVQTIPIFFFLRE